MARRRALRKRQAAREAGQTGLERAWQGKQETELGTSLPDDFPALEVLRPAGYTTFEDLSGVSADELTKVQGIGKKTAQKILDAAALGPVVPTPSNPAPDSPLASGTVAGDNLPPEGSQPENPDGTVPENEKDSLSGSGETSEGTSGTTSEAGAGG